MKGKSRRRDWAGAAFTVLFSLLLALWTTWPLLASLSLAIPYDFQARPGWEMVPGVPFDHLQSYFYFWLFGDVFLDPARFFTNPYEFNTTLNPQGLPIFAGFPLSLLHLPLAALWGNTVAYNLLLLLSYPLTALAGHALGRRLWDSAWAGIFLGLTLAFLPFRVSRLMVGQMYGFGAFLLPLTLVCLEAGWKAGREGGNAAPWLWGLAGGLAMLCAGFLEPHLFYYASLLLGLYVPARLLLGMNGPSPGPVTEPPGGNAAAIAGNLWSMLLPILLGGAGLGLGMALYWSPPDLLLGGASLLTVALTLAGAPALWLAFRDLLVRLSFLTPAAAARRASGAFWPLALIIPAGAAAALGASPSLLGWALALASAAVLPVLFRPPLILRFPTLPPGWWKAPLALAAGAGLGLAWRLVRQTRVVEASIAGEGRGIPEVLAFSSRPADLIRLTSHGPDQAVYLGLPFLGLALLAVILALPVRRDLSSARAGSTGLCFLLGILLAALSLGPVLEQFPLYQFLYDHLPYFNFPRWPGRLALPAALFLGLAAASIPARLGRRPGPWGKAGAALLTGLIVLSLAATGRPGLSPIPPDGPVEESIRRLMSRAGERTGGPVRVLGLPLEAGNSVRSSIYELLISRTRVPMINGYAPVPSRDYVNRIFRTLYPLNLGWLDQDSLGLLLEQRVDLMVFYEDPLIYTREYSPFPGALTRERLTSLGIFRPLVTDGRAFLFGVAPQSLRPASPEDVVSPVTLVWEAAQLGRTTGGLVHDPSGSAYLLQNPKAEGTLRDDTGGPTPGNVSRALAGRHAPGLISMGPHKLFPPGGYLARFRLRRGKGTADGPGIGIGKAMVTGQGGETVWAEAELTPERLPADGEWHEVGAPFRLTGPGSPEFRVYFNGRADLELDRVLVSFSGMEAPQPFYPAARLWRQTGDLSPDGEVEGGLAVAARAGWHPPLYLMYGPNLTLDPGRYRALFRMARGGKSQGGGVPAGAGAAVLEAVRGFGLTVLGKREVPVEDLTEGYAGHALDFRMDRRAELELRVRFTGRVDLRLAGVELQMAAERRIDPETDGKPAR